MPTAQYWQEKKSLSNNDSYKPSLSSAVWFLIMHRKRASVAMSGNKIVIIPCPSCPHNT